MRASGDQLRQITASSTTACSARSWAPSPFDQTPHALAALAKGGIRGKAVITGP